MARRARKPRDRADRTLAAAPPYIERKLPHFDPLDEAQVVALEGQVDWILEHVGIAFREDPVALEIWRAAGVKPGGAHTMRNYQSAFYEPALSDSENVESWEENGSEDMRMRAFRRWNKLLDHYEPPPMDEAKREQLDDFVARRKRELPDAWY